MKLPFPSKRILLAILVAGLIAVTPIACLGLFVASAPGSGQNVQIVEFAKGVPLKEFSHELESKGLISSARLFVLLSRIKGADNRIQAGVYRLTDAMKPDEILQKMVTGDIYAQRFAVPEGYSVYQIAELLDSKGILKKETFLKQCTNPALAREVGISGTTGVEGYLYPSTYNITPNMDEKAVITMMVNQFKTVCASKYAPIAQRTGRPFHEIITLASMIEKEAVQPSEQPLIASVFLNRLRRGMRLQSDPTAVYGVRAFAGSVSRQDILRASPYNTYLINGLPPGPIGNPGNSAIEAVLKPANTNYLYFVAKKDGTHHFSSTLEEHNKAVNLFLRGTTLVTSGSSGSYVGQDNGRPHPAGGR